MADFEMTAGDDKLLRYTVTEIVDEVETILDLTGALEILWRLAKAQGKPAVLTKSLNVSPGGIAIVDAPNGKFVVTLVPSDTAGLVTTKEATFYLEVEVTDVGGLHSTVRRGEVTIQPQLP